jgi:molybdopterin-guanine dinucleotide biosynthesis protein
MRVTKVGTWLAVLFALLVLGGCDAETPAAGDAVNDVDDHGCLGGKCDNPYANAAPVPLPSKFNIPADRWIPLKSYWDKAYEGEINGTFFVAVEGGVTYVQLPIYFVGANRCTPEYYDKVVAPIERALAAAGEPLDTLLDTTDHQPTRDEFSPEFVARYLADIAAGYESMFAQAGVKVEVIVKQQDIELTAFETGLLGGGRLPTSIDTLKNKIGSDLLKQNRSKTYRRGDYLTFLLTPFANIFQPYAQTEAFNPSLGQPVPSVLHELGHFTFMYQYEGYYDAYSPPGALMGDTASQARAATLGIPTFLSLAERLLVLERILEAAAAKGRDVAALEASHQALVDREDAWKARAKVGTVAAGGIKVAGTSQVLLLDAADWATLFAQVDMRKKVLAVIDDAGQIVVVNGYHKQHGQYVKFMGNEIGLTYSYMESLIQERLAGGG